jgi:hypothetical protein
MRLSETLSLQLRFLRFHDNDDERKKKYEKFPSLAYLHFIVGAVTRALMIFIAAAAQSSLEDVLLLLFRVCERKKHEMRTKKRSQRGGSDPRTTSSLVAYLQIIPGRRLCYLNAP